MHDATIKTCKSCFGNVGTESTMSTWWLCEHFLADRFVTITNESLDLVMENLL